VISPPSFVFLFDFPPLPHTTQNTLCSSLPLPSLESSTPDMGLILSHSFGTVLPFLDVHVLGASPRSESVFFQMAYWVFCLVRPPLIRRITSRLISKEKAFPQIACLWVFLLASSYVFPGFLVLRGGLFPPCLRSVGPLYLPLSGFPKSHFPPFRDLSKSQRGHFLVAVLYAQKMSFLSLAPCFFFFVFTPTISQSSSENFLLDKRLFPFRSSERRWFPC